MINVVNKGYKIITVISWGLFLIFSFTGFFAGREISYLVLLDNFGEPNGEYIFSFAIIMFFFSTALFIIGIFTTFIAMHWLGKRLKISVARPAFYGFLLYLLTLLTVILLYNRTH